MNVTPNSFFSISLDPLLPQLRTALNSIKSQHPDTFYAWKIAVGHQKSLQTLVLGHQEKDFEKYQNREVTDQNYQIEVYSRHSTPTVMGNSTFTIDPLDNLEKQVLKTFKNSLMVGNKPWDLPNKLNGIYEKVLTVDPSLSENLKSAHDKMLGEINNKLKSLKKVNVNSVELFSNLYTQYFETSLGLSGQKEKSDIYFEIALEKLPLPNTQEVLKYKKAINIEDLNLSSFIDEAVEETLSLNDANIPKTSSNCTILIDGEAISSLLSNLLVQLSAQSEYVKSPVISVGSSLVEGEKKKSSDKISITLDPSTPLMALTTAYTNEGMKPIKAQIVKDDIVLSHTIHHRMGQYLNKEPNYIEGNMVVSSGIKSKAELLASVKECIEVLSFSSLLINSNTLTWSSEIKLGKFYKNGKLDSMIKGGVLSGSIKENLADFHFSKEEIKINELSGGFGITKGYIGPKFMLIQSGVKVVGE